MQVLLRLLRHRGVALPDAAVRGAQWTEGRLQHLVEDGARALGIFSITARPDSSPMAVLYGATVARVVDESMILRGIERVETPEGDTAAVV